MGFLDPRKLPPCRIRSRGELPHLEKPGATYFVTFRLFDAVLTTNDPGQTAAANDLDALGLARRFDPPISRASCVLAQPHVAAVVSQAIQSGSDLKYKLHAWCVMPNHVHVVFAPFAAYRLSTILQGWKGSTSRRINQLLARSGPLWERESFDHLIRNSFAMEKFVHYVNENPVEAGLCERSSDWPFSSASAIQRPVDECLT